MASLLANKKAIMLLIKFLKATKVRRSKRKRGRIEKEKWPSRLRPTEIDLKSKPKSYILIYK